MSNAESKLLPKPSAPVIRMGIRAKMLTLVAVGFLLLLALQWLLFNELVKPQVESLDSSRIEQELVRVRQALAAEENNLSRTVSDWAAWDELAAYAEQPQLQPAQDFLGKNPDVSLERLQVNGFLLTDLQANPLIVNGFNFPLDQSWQPVEWARQQAGSAQKSFNEKTDTHFVGFLKAPSNQLMLAAAYPVVGSSGVGPARGVLSMMRLVDAKFVEQLESRTQLHLKLQVLDADSPAELLQVAELASANPTGTLVSQKEENELQGYLLLSDLDRKPAAIIELVGGSMYFKQGLETFKFFLVLTVLAMLLLLLIISITQSRVLSRLLQVSSRVDKISRSHDLSLRIELPPGNDEIVDLAESVNRFLDTRREMAIELGASEERFLQLTNTAPVFIWMSNMAGDFTWFNDEMLRFVGLERDQFEIFHVVQLIAAQDTALYEKVVERARESEKGYQLELRIRRHDGEFRWILLRASPMFSQDNRMIGYAGIGVDINERKQMEAKVEFLAHYDALTELPNRTQLTERLSRAIFDAHFNGTLVAVLFIDLDRFKNINDTLGHQVGDWLLQAVSQRLQHTLRSGDMVARLGGDEFVLVLSGLQSQEHMLPLVVKIQQSLSQPYFLSGHQLQVTPSIGISMYPKDSLSIHDLLRHADTAMYSVKTGGRNGYSFYDSSMDVTTKERLELESIIRTGLDQQKFFLEYQPQVSGDNQQIFGVEALLRLHGKDGLIPPDTFIPVAEETGQILALGEWVLREACMQAKAWQDMGWKPVVMAVNISAVQLQRIDMVALVSSVLAETGLAARFLELEITERVIMGDSAELIDTLEALRTLGVRLALDDFGTGYSSLSYLKSFPFDVLKIDRSFVQGISTSADDLAITEAVIALGRSMKLEVLAEGVETPEHVRILLEKGCKHMQGYNFSRSLSPAALGKWLMPN